MSGPTTRDWVVTIDKAVELKPNEIAISGTRDGQPTNGVWRIEQTRMRQWEATVDGKKVIAEGRFVSSGTEWPWLNKCGAP